MTDGDLFRGGLFHAYKAHYHLRRQRASGSSMPSDNDDKQWIKDLNHKVCD